MEFFEQPQCGDSKLKKIRYKVNLLLCSQDSFFILLCFLENKGKLLHKNMANCSFMTSARLFSFKLPILGIGVANVFWILFI